MSIRQSTYGIKSVDKSVYIVLCLYLSLCIFFCHAAQATPIYRPQKELKTLNTESYELRVQRDGRVDVVLRSGERLFDNAQPYAWIAESDKAQVLPTDGRFLSRTAVNNPLGDGNALTMPKKSFTWTLQSYPTKPFITVQLSYVNDTRKPVRIARLSPWSVGLESDGALVLGAETRHAHILEHGHLFQNGDIFAKVVTENSTSQWNLAVHNPVSGLSLIAGFLTNVRAHTQVSVQRSEDTPPDRFDTFAAECIYDPPLEIAPGERLDSEILYLGITEGEPLTGLERFGKAAAVWNGVRDSRPFMPHGWDSWSTQYVRGINEASMMANLDALDKNLKRFGWNHFAIDAGWAQGRGDWDADPEKFPKGMGWIANEIHARGMTAGLWIDPFTVDKDSRLAQEHPEWLATPDARGKAMMGDALILDVSAPGAYEHVRDLAKKIGDEWGFDAIIEADFVYHLLLAENYAAGNVTRIEVLRRGMQALREGLGPDRFLMCLAPQPVTGVYAEGIRVGRDCAPVWSGNSLLGPWGCKEALTNAIRRFYMAPHLYVIDQDCAFFGHTPSLARWNVPEGEGVTVNQSIAWLTGAAMTGGVVKIGEPFTDLSPQEIDILRKLLPAPGRSARPIDLFQEASPQIWHLPLKSPAGEWDILGLFNWDATAPEMLTVDFSRLGLADGAYYTVYDFWKEHYYGTAQGNLQIEVPPASVRVIGLRRFDNHPMLLSTDRHFTQGALDHETLAWDAVSGALNGAFQGTEDCGYTLSILVPPPYAMRRVEVSCGEASTRVEEGVLRIAFHNKAAGPVAWRVEFSAES